MRNLRAFAGCLGMLTVYGMTTLIWVGAVAWYYYSEAFVWATVWLLLPPIGYIGETGFYLLSGQWIAFLVMLSPIVGVALISWGVEDA